MGWQLSSYNGLLDILEFQKASLVIEDPFSQANSGAPYAISYPSDDD
jgi:hypothetical protein